jgi:hypothetical protein
MGPTSSVMLADYAPRQLGQEVMALTAAAQKTEA